MSEVLLGVKPFPQPSPARNPGGDCFACALKAAIDHIFPEKPVPFDTAWEAFKTEAYGGGTVLSNTWPTMRSAPYALSGQGWRIEVRADLVMPVWDIDTWSHPWWWSINDDDWAYRLEAWLRAGWIALAEMNFAGEGPLSAGGSRNHTDHFIVLDGQRHFWQPSDRVEDAYSLDHETHVVCSGLGAYWIRTDDLLRKHGVAGLRLIRRDERPYRKKN